MKYGLKQLRKDFPTDIFTDPTAVDGYNYRQQELEDYWQNVKEEIIRNK